MKIDVTAQGVTARSRDDRIIGLYMGDRWIGNAEWAGNTLAPVGCWSCDIHDVIPQLALALSVAPEADWTIRSFATSDHRYTFSERAYATELEAQNAFHSAVANNKEHGGGVELKFRGKRVDIHSCFARED